MEDIFPDLECCQCFESYNLEDRIPYICIRKHTVCSGCAGEERPYCYICKKFNMYEDRTTKKMVLAKKEYDKLKNETDELKKKADDDAKKMAEITKAAARDAAKLVEIEKKAEADRARKQIGTVKCRECQKEDNEADVVVCKSCAIAVIDETGTKLVVSPICAVCAIRNHMKKSHEVIDYFPILCNTQYLSHLENLKVKREDHKKMKEAIKKDMDEIINTINQEELHPITEISDAERYGLTLALTEMLASLGGTELDSMQELVRRGRNSEIQQNIVSKIAQQIEKFNFVMSGLEKVVNCTNSKLKVFPIFQKMSIDKNTVFSSSLVDFANSTKIINEKDCFSEVQDIQGMLVKSRANVNASVISNNNTVVKNDDEIERKRMKLS